MPTKDEDKVKVLQYFLVTLTNFYIVGFRIEEHKLFPPTWLVKIDILTRELQKSTLIFGGS